MGWGVWERIREAVDKLSNTNTIKTILIAMSWVRFAITTLQGSMGEKARWKKSVRNILSHS
jgi:hypothetical protein